MKKNIVIAGGGGHAAVIIDALKKSGDFSIEGIIDPSLAPGSSVLGVKVIGDDGKFPELYKKGVRNAFIGVGSVGDCRRRKVIYADLKKYGFKLPAVVHPKAVVAESVELGEGAFVAACAVIGPRTKIGKNAIINTSSSIDHDCVIGDFAHIAPGAVLSGGVTVGAETHIGTGANVVQMVNIGEKCMVKAGTTVKRHVKQ